MSLAVSVATGALAISVLPWAAVADRIGRARAMTISAAIAATAGMLVPLAPSFEVLLALRGVSGLALGALPALAIAHLVAQARPGRVSAIGGLYIAGTTIGGLTGRVLTGAVGGVAGWRWGLATTATLVVIAAIVFVILLPRDHLDPEAARTRPRPGRNRGRIRLALADRTVWVFYAQAFLLMGGFVTVYNLLAFRLLDDPYRLPASIVSLLFLTYLVGTVGSSGVGRMVGRLGRKAVLAAAGYGMAFGVALTLATPLWCVLAGLGRRDLLLLRRPCDRGNLGGRTGASRQIAGLRAVLAVVLRRIQPGRLPGSCGVRQFRLDRGDDDGDRGHRAGSEHRDARRAALGRGWPFARWFLTMTALPELPASRRTAVKVVAAVVLRVTVSIILLFAAYYLIPTKGDGGESDLPWLFLELAVFAIIVAIQVPIIVKSDYPVLRAVEALAVTIPLVLADFFANLPVQLRWPIPMRSASRWTTPLPCISR